MKMNGCEGTTFTFAHPTVHAVISTPTGVCPNSYNVAVGRLACRLPHKHGKSPPPKSRSDVSGWRLPNNMPSPQFSGRYLEKEVMAAWREKESLSSHHHLHTYQHPHKLLQLIPLDWLAPVLRPCHCHTLFPPQSIFADSMKAPRPLHFPAGRAL